MKKVLSIVCAAAALSLTGCASAAAPARASYDAARSVYDAVLVRYRAAQEACLDVAAPAPCISDVRTRWAPTRKPADALRAALVALGAAVGLYDAFKGTGRAPTPADVQKLALEAVAAAEALVRAEQEVTTP